MYIRELQVENLRLIRNVEVNFVRADGTVRMWTVLVGENGLCKTTLLQAIGLVATGAERANQLADVPSLPDRRLTSAAVRICGTFGFERNGVQTGVTKAGTWPGARVRSEIWIQGERKLFSGKSSFIDSHTGDADPLGTAQALGLPGWFVAGYGVLRELPAPLTHRWTEDTVLNRLSPLYGRATVIGTEFADLLDDDLARLYARLVRKALVGTHLLPLVRGVELRGRGGVRRSTDLVEASRFELSIGSSEFRVPATWLSQGYQAMIAWVADLIGHAVLEAGRPIELHDINGLILIDELDLFLHPTWQVRLVRVLKQAFPNVQFVATTHSPMVLAGLEQDEILLLDNDEEGNIVINAAPAPPKMMSGSEIYALFFELDRQYPESISSALQEYGFLALDPRRDDIGEQRLRDLREFLRSEGVDPQFDPVPRSELA